MKPRTLALGIALLMAASFGQADAAGACADDSAHSGGVHPGGEWRSLGGSLENARNQPNEDVINASTVANVGVAWTFDLAGLGTLQNTPVVADGCVYLATSTGNVVALNADEGGEPVWTTSLAGDPAGSLVGGVITGSPTVTGGTVYVAVSDGDDPKVFALDQATGQVKWSVVVLDDAKRPDGDPSKSYGNTVVAAPVVWNGLLFQGIMADEASSVARGGYAILDVAAGLAPEDRLIVQDWTITDDEYAAGYRGASIWCTASVDQAGYVYACGGNPASKQIEARNSNALLKIDMNPSRPATFGTIVDTYKGDVDQFYPGLDRQPACDQVPTTVVWSPTCVQLDLDFGASPSLFRDGIGRLMVGDLQKSGVYHAVYADTMSRAWTAQVGTPCVACNAASPAVDTTPSADGGQVYTVATVPGQVWALTKEHGRARWVMADGVGGTHFQPVSTANGVVYTMNNAGDLTAYDAATGLPVLKRNLAQDVGAYAGDLSSQGVSIARNTIYAASASFVVAYR
ncbi:MAG TPA: PQQ-binding-like beta-propeller repeat protein [Actinomycetota bacterium]